MKAIKNQFSINTISNNLKRKIQICERKCILVNLCTHNMRFMFWYILLTNLDTYSLIITPKPVSTNFLSTCIEKVLHTVDKKKIIYGINLENQIKYPIININITIQLKWFEYEASDVCIINLTDDNWDLILLTLFKNPNTNPRGLFIVIVNNVDSYLFTEASKYYITKFIVIEKKISSSIRFYTYRPYLQQNVNNPTIDSILLTTCSKGILDNYINWSLLNDIPKYWKNTTVNIINNMSPPYTTCLKCKEERGIEFDIFDIIVEKLQFLPNFTRTGGFVVWGDKINGSYNLLWGKLEKRRGDMVIGAFHPKSEEHLNFDMTFGHMEDATYWLVPKAKLLPLWKRLNLIFSLEVYLILFISIIVTTIVSCYLYKESFSSALIMLYQILLECSLHRMPDFRTLIITWTAYCLVISTVFKSKLINVMTENMYDHQIESLSDIVNSKLVINIDTFIATFYYHYTNPDEKYILKNYVHCDDHFACVRRTAFQQDAVTVDFERSYQYTALFLDTEGNLLLHLCKTPIFPVQIHLFFVKGYPIFPQINDLLIRIRSSGFIQYQYNKMSHHTQMVLSKRKHNLAAKVLSVKHLQIAFFIFCIGMILSSFVFLGEYLSKAFT